MIEESRGLNERLYLWRWILSTGILVGHVKINMMCQFSRTTVNSIEAADLCNFLGALTHLESCGRKIGVLMFGGRITMLEGHLKYSCYAFIHSCQDWRGLQSPSLPFYLCLVAWLLWMHSSLSRLERLEKFYLPFGLNWWLPMKLTNIYFSFSWLLFSCLKFQCDCYIAFGEH